MFKKLLVAIDLSQMGEQVFNVALSLAKLTQADLMVMHVLTPDEDGSPELVDFVSLAYHPAVTDVFLESYHNQWTEFEKQGLSYLQHLTEQAQLEGVNIEISQNYGKPGSTICAVADSWGAELIVVGRRGLSGLSGIFAGSVSNYVLHHAPCSVLIVHRDTDMVSEDRETTVQSELPIESLAQVQ